MPDDFNTTPSVTEVRGPSTRFVIALLILALGVGVGIRVLHLTRRGLTQNEIFVPGIPLPPVIARPEARLDFLTTITSTIAIEPHPPGYYVFMLAWVRAFGDSIVALRLPSVLFGVAGIGLIGLLGIRLRLAWAGVIAALLWAVSGADMVQDREARMYPMVCMLSLLATWLLVECVRRGPKRSTRWDIAYVVTLLCGLCTSHFYWGVLAMHAGFSLLRARESRWISLAYLQRLTMTLASPLLAVAVFQAGRKSYLPDDAGYELLDYFAEFYAWSPRAAEGFGHSLFGVAGVAIALACLGLALLGAATVYRFEPPPAATSARAEPLWISQLIGGLAVLAIAAFAYAVRHRHVEGLGHRTLPILTTMLVPVGLVLFEMMLRRSAMIGFIGRIARGKSLAPASIVAILALPPPLLLALISLKMPVIAMRTVLAFGPYLLMLIALGVQRAFRRRMSRGVIVIALLGLGVRGVVVWDAVPDRQPDYGGMAQAVEPEARSDDLWFAYKSWRLTPIFYYLHGPAHSIVGTHYTEALRAHPRSRVWLLGFTGSKLPPDEVSALNGYTQVRHFEVRRMQADLYEPPSTR